MLEIRNISKSFFRKEALHDVSLSVNKGEIFGLLGPNGAGKTTLIRVINRIVEPDNGSIRFNGDLMTEDDLKNIGYLPEEQKAKYPLKQPDMSTLTEVSALCTLEKSLSDSAIISTDVGQHQMIACRYADFKESKSNITSGGLGTMGFCLPAAIGAKMGAPEREVVAISGDGGYQMTIQELGTIFQQKLAVKIVVLNNDFLGMVRQWQQLFFDKRYASTEMINPDFVAIAKGYYLNARRVEKREDLAEAVQEMIASKEPYFLEVRVEKEDNVFPMIPSGASVSEIRLD